MIIDVHAHLEFENFDKDRDEVIQRAKDAGVITVICNGTDPVTNRKVLELSKKYDIIKPALGYYPCEVDKIDECELFEEIEFIRNSKPVAIGEIGLDLKYPNNFEKQKEYFKLLIELAQDLDVPIIVHSRFAEKEAIEIMEELKVKKAIMHCFSGSKKLVKRCIDNGWYLSIPASVTRTQQFQDNVEMLPLTQLLTETDSPFLVHDPEIERNEPCYIAESLKTIADIKKVTVEELKNIIYINYNKLF